MLHYLRTTRDARIAFGWGGGRMGFGGRKLDRLELDPQVTRQVHEDLLRFFPQLRDRAVTHAWGGPIDVSPTHLPIFGSRGPVHHGYGFTGNGVGPSYLGGEILARLALDRRDELTRLAVVEPDRKLFPPEPLRWAGGSVIRGALVRRDAAEDSGRSADRVTTLIASLPRLLGLHLPR
jgi:glycine/D-amino acid oxidase-like deaminating enzyme